MQNTNDKSEILCACGCGQPKPKGVKAYRRGHRPGFKALDPEHLCLCGCGGKPPHDCRYMYGHKTGINPVRKRKVTFADLGKKYWNERKLEAAMADATIPKCACGCGFPAVKGKNYKRGHLPKDLPCECGCGQLCKPGCTYIFGHQWVGKKRPEFTGGANPASIFKQKTGHGYMFGKVFAADDHRRELASKRAKARLRMGAHTFTGLNDKVAAALFCLQITGWNREYPVDRYKCDFAWPELKLALEVQGCYWHLCTICPPLWKALDEKKQLAARTSDARKLACLESQGWKVVYLWEHDTKTEDALIDALEHLLLNAA